MVKTPIRAFRRIAAHQLTFAGLHLSVHAVFICPNKQQQNGKNNKERSQFRYSTYDTCYNNKQAAKESD
jgi:hypothetical protein